MNANDDNAVVIHGLTKRYEESGGLALDGLDLVVPRGSVFGLVGGNGSGSGGKGARCAGTRAVRAPERKIDTHTVEPSALTSSAFGSSPNTGIAATCW